MRWVRLGSFTIALLSVLAGCISKDAPQDDAPPSEVGTVGVIDANESTAAPDGRGELSAFQETNRTVTNGTDAMEHKHDYWKGETRQVIAQWDSGLIPLPLIPEGKAPGTAIADYDIPEPGLVYEGTKQLELLFTRVRPLGTGPAGDPAHPAITIYVDYLSAADEPGQFRAAGQALPDVPLVIDLEPRMADMPHQTKSLWVFRIYTGEANAWQYNLTITAVKGYDVVDWPPHPDLYAESPTRVIHDGPVRGEYAGDADNNLYGTDATWTFPQRIISYGTDSVQVTVEKGAWDAQWPEPLGDGWILEVNNASYIPKVGNGAPAGYQLEPLSVDGATYVFDVPVDPAGYDTPYGQHSRWSFRFVPKDDHGLPWAIEHDLRIVATGHSVATEPLPT